MFRKICLLVLSLCFTSLILFSFSTAEELQVVSVTPGSKEAPTKIHENILYQTHGYGRFSVVSPVDGKLYFTAHQFYGSDEWFRIIFYSPEGRKTESYAYEYKTKSIINHSIEVEAKKTYYFYIEGGFTKGGLNDPWYVNSVQFSICFTCFDNDGLTEVHYSPISYDTYIDIPATCTDEGCRQLYCPLCDNAYWYKNIPATGHKPGKWETVYEPTCTTTGERELSCENCGEILSTEELPMIDHVYGEWEVIREATYREPGYRERTCESCGYVEEDEIVLPTTDKILEYGDYEYELQDDGTARLIGYYGYDDSITIPDMVEGHTIASIARTAFDNIYSIMKIVIPDTILYIEVGTLERFEDCTIVVGRDSYARQYAIEHQIKYTYPDANDWLND